MSRLDSILLPLDGSPESARSAGCAMWLAQALGATLHVLHATTQPLSAEAALARLRVPHAQGARVVVHQVLGAAEAAVLQEIAVHRIDLVVMSARGESVSAGGPVALSRRLGSVARAVIEGSPVPVVLFPRRYRETLPWASMLAAASGEAAADPALRAAAQLAAALRLKLTVVHCQDDAPGATTAPLVAYADAPHHEYPQRLDHLVERGLAGHAPEQAHRDCEILLCRGDPAASLLEQVARHHSSVLALGWHGALGTGRAPVLKRLLEEAECALLLVRETAGVRARLKVGSALDAD